MPIIILAITVLTIIFIQHIIYKRLWDKGLGYDVWFSSVEAFEGDTLYIYEQLTNKKFLPLPWVHVETVLPPGLAVDGAFGDSLYAVMTYTAVRKKHPLICQKRGIYTLRGAKLTLRDLLYTEKYQINLPQKSELCIYPKPLDHAPHIEDLYKYLDAAVLANRLINPDPFEFKGIRDYLPTDSLKSINFKASAVSQKLMVNIHAPTVDKKLMLALNLEGWWQSQNTELYEQCIRLTATLAERYINDNVQLGFLTNGRDAVNGNFLRLDIGSSTAHLYKIYEALARISITFRYEPMANYINNLFDREVVYLFISPYAGEDMLEAFEEARNRGVDAYMIIPTLTDDAFEWRTV